MAVATAPLPTVRRGFQLTWSGLVARTAVAFGVVALVLLLPLTTNQVWDDRISIAAIFAIIGLSINVLTGYAGQISLGHQAFVGIGAFMSAFVAVHHHMGFVAGLVSAAAIGALMAGVLGLIALRIKGLYLALITLAFGLVAAGSIFSWTPFTGGGAGAPAPRPGIFQSNRAFAYLCIIGVAFALFIDWRLSKSKGGRAVIAVRNNERVAATLGVNVTAYKLYAFMVSGFLAGLAGSLFAHQSKFVYSANFDLFTAALPWVIMAVVGGLGSRAGVVIVSAFFGVFRYLMPIVVRAVTLHHSNLPDTTVATYTPLVAAGLLLITLTLYPGGLGQQILPLRRWLAGGRFIETREEAQEVAGQGILLLGVVLFLVLGNGFHLGHTTIKAPLAVAGAIGALMAALSVVGMRRYVRLHRPELATHGKHMVEPEEEEEEEEDGPLFDERPDNGKSTGEADQTMSFSAVATKERDGQAQERDGQADQTTELPAVDAGATKPRKRGLKAFDRKKAAKR